VNFQYTPPPSGQIPDSVTSLAVAEFAGPADDQSWGKIVADRLTEALEKAKLPHPVRIIGPQETKAASQPFSARARARAGAEAAVVDTASAVEYGKRLGADAVVYGTVSVVWAGPLHQPEATQCDVTVRFVIDDVKTASTLAALSFSSRYPPEGAPPSPAGAAAPEAVELIAQCVNRFIAWLSPQTVSVTEHLQFGRTQLVLEGNHLARQGQYSEALGCYLRGMEESPGDDGAVFNAGLMYEAMGQFDKARQFYDRAALMHPSEQVDQARRRIQGRPQSQ
jgi:tetratricopeptide (TPR) repeat protein